MNFMKSINLLILAGAMSGCGGDSNTRGLPIDEASPGCSYTYIENQSNYQLTVTLLSKYYSVSENIVIETSETKELNHGCILGSAPELGQLIQSIVVATTVNGEIRVVYSGLKEYQWKNIAEDKKRKEYYLTLTDLDLDIR